MTASEEPQRGRYRALMARPGVPRLVLSGMVSLLSVGMDGLAMVLYAHDVSGTFVASGVVSGASALGMAVGAPSQARLMRRLARRTVIVGCAAGYVTFCGLIVLAAEVLASVPLMAAGAGLAAMSRPVISTSVKAVWQELLADDPRLRVAAFSIDTAMIDAVFVGGPLLVTLIAGLTTVAVAVALSATTVALGAIGVATSPHLRTTTIDRVVAHVPGSAWTAGARVLLVGALFTGLAFGSVEVGLPAFAESIGQHRLAGLPAASLAIGSVAGGLVFGAIYHSRDLAATLRALTVVFPLSFSLLLSGSSLALMVALAVVGGLAFAPMLSTNSQLLGALVPRTFTTEAYAFNLTSISIGGGVGSAVAGVLAEHIGWRAAIALAVASGCGLALTVWSSRRSLQPV